VYPQLRLGTRYEKSLKRRFEKADQVFSEIYLRKARLDKKGLRTYTAVELRQDLYAAAFGHGLCAEALMAYFQVLHRREILRICFLGSSSNQRSRKFAVANECDTVSHSFIGTGRSEASGRVNASAGLPVCKY